MSQSKQELEGKGAIPNEIRPFRIEIPQADLDDLRERLVRTRWPAQLPGASGNLGYRLLILKILRSIGRTIIIGVNTRPSSMNFHNSLRRLMDRQSISYM